MVLNLNVVKLPKMKKREIDQLLRDQMLCRIAFKGDEYPYMAPFQYVFIDGSLYFHFTNYGKKMKLIDRDKRVCVEIEKYTPDLTEYNFVVLRGVLEVVKDPQERAKAINRIAAEGKQKLSTNFLAAHGLPKEEGWSSFTPEREVLIVRFKQEYATIGLKSPE